VKRRRIWWIAIPVVALSVIAGGVLYVWYVLNNFGECGTDVRRTILSPNGKMSLVVFGRECGATVEFNTQLSIAPAGGPFSPEKNPAFFVTSGLQDVTASWLGDSAVEIAVVPGPDKILKREQNVGDVKVVYK
jgi:hypothetical protein